MTKKDYIKFAAMLKDALTYSQSTGIGASTVKDVIYRTADLFASDNPNFARNRFLTACGMES